MNRDRKTRQKEFRKNILKTQLLSIGDKFRKSAKQWLDETKNIMLDVSAETKQHPNRLLAELRKINYERAYIMFKIDAVDKNQQLPMPLKLRQKMKKTEMEVQFQQEFPDEYQIFTGELKEKLRQKLHYPTMTSPLKRVNEVDENLNWNIDLGAPIVKNKPIVAVRPNKPRKIHSPCVNNIMKMLQIHGTQNLLDPRGYFLAPAFTKAKVEKLLGIWMTQTKFNHLKSKMNEKQKRKKLGQAKRDFQRRKERQNKRYDFINPL